MKKNHLIIPIIVVMAIIIAFFFLYQNSSESEEPLTELTQNEDLSEAEAYQQLRSAKLYFQENQGQVDEQVQFFSKNPGQTIFFTNNEIVYSQEVGRDEEEKLIGGVIRQTFIDGGTDITYSGEEEQEAKVNYFIGNNPEEWQSGIPTFAQLRSSNIYPGVSASYFGTGEGLKQKYEFDPGIDPFVLKIQLKGVNKLELLPSGDIGIQTDWGNFRLRRPIVKQVINDEDHIRQARYQLIDEITYTVVVDDLDANYSLFIQI